MTGMPEFEAFLTQRGHRYEMKDIPYGRSIRCASGEIVNVYQTGKVVVQGKPTALRQELLALSESSLVPAAPVEQAAPATGAVPISPGVSNQVFVVYGHDREAREGLELVLHKMGMEPIVLANLPGSGDTVIEKLEHFLRHSNNVGFACVLLTPDDEGHPVGEPESKQYRARQNVILELGMVLSRIGRERVAILHKQSVERPSDIEGLIYIPFQEHVREAAPDLFKQLTALGYLPKAAGL